MTKSHTKKTVEVVGMHLKSGEKTEPDWDTDLGIM